MGIALAVAVALVAAPRVASPPWHLVGIDSQMGGFFADHVAQKLRARNIDVVTAQDIATLLGMERQRSLLGCDTDSASCLAELGSALGCDHTLIATVARIDDVFQANLRVVGSIDGKVKVEDVVRAKSQRELLDALTLAADRIADGLSPPQASAPSRAVPAVLMAGGVALGVASAVSFGFAVTAKGHQDALLRDSGGASRTEVLAMLGSDAATGSTAQTLSAVLLGVAVVALAVGVLLWVMR